MSHFKKFMVAAAVVLGVVLYPSNSKGKTDSAPEKLVLSENNTVLLRGVINGESVAKISADLKKLDSKSFFGNKKPINLYIYSPGGEIQPGFELLELAKGLNRPVDTITAFGASMAFQTVQGLGKRHILASGVLMSHRAAGGFEGTFGGQHPSQLDSRYGFWLQRLQELDETTVSRTGGKQTMASYQEAYKNEAWFTGKQAVQQGYADDLVTVQCDKSLDGVETHTINFLGMQIQYDISKCPLITTPTNVHLGDEIKGNPPVDKLLAQEVKAKFLESFDLEKTVQ